MSLPVPGATRRACLHCLGLGLAFGTGALRAQEAASVPAGVASAPVAPAAADTLPAELPRLQRPPIDTDEGGLWALMDREEARMRRSPFVVRDAELNEYLRGILCRLAVNQCPDVRVHLLRTPLFNASMAPNGMMVLWSGLLLRMENEAQLAAVLGHELGHYLERHSVERLRDQRSRAAFAQFLGLFGAVGAIGQLGVMAGMFAFSREHEQRADQLGVALMRRAGYDPAQAAQVWDNLLGELRVTEGEAAGRRSPMMATHPPVEHRRDTLLRLAGSAGGAVRAAEYQAAIANQRAAWLQDEIRRGQYEESVVLFDRLIRQSPADAALLHARGEVHRLHGGSAGLARAQEDLEAALRLPSPPAAAYRALGLVLKQRGQLPAAAQALRDYLAAAPDAADAALIRTYLQEIAP